MIGTFRVIPGQLVIVGYEPDGDSVRFIADDPSLFDGLRNEHRARPGKDGSLQLRFEGIDAPELHYGALAQPEGEKTRNVLLKAIGFDHVQYNPKPSTKVKSSTPNRIAAHVLTKAFDPHGRPIAYVFVGPPDEAAGADIPVDTDVVKRSLNAKMVSAGWAYPLLYTSAPPDHRAWFRKAADDARGERAGVWADDSTPQFRLVDDASVTAPDGALIFPKFFRRAVDCLKAGYQNLPDWLRATPQENDRVVVNRVEIHLSELFVQQNSRVAVQGDIIDFVFIEK